MILSEWSPLFQALNKNIICRDFFKGLFVSPFKTSEKPGRYNLKDAEQLKQLAVNDVAIEFFKAMPPLDPNKPMKHRNKLIKRDNPKIKRFACRELLDRNPLKLKYKERRWAGHSYRYYVEQHLLHLLQEYQIAYDQVYVSRETLAKELRISMKRLDKAIKRLQDWKAITVISGKAKYTSNIYILSGGYDKIPTRAPEGYKRPRHIHFVIARKLLKAKCVEFKQWIYEHILEDITHHLLCKGNLICTFLKRGDKFFEKSADPPKSKRKLACWHILKAFKFSYKDKAILSSYGEAPLQRALEDIEKYKGWGNTVDNEVPFLISRCKKHKEKLKTLAEAKLSRTPQEALEWTKGYLKTNAKKLRFLKSGKKLNRVVVAENTSPIIDLRLHKEYPELSVLNIFQKVGGHWVDRSFTFKQPDVAEAILDYLEKSYAKPPKWDKDQLKKPASSEQAKKTLDWCKELLTSLKDKLRFLSPGKSVVRDIKAENTAPIVDLKILPTAAERSVLRIYQRINGYWIDKEYTFDQPDLQEDLTKHLEKVLA